MTSRESARHLHPRHGPHQPVAGTPPRRRASVRRTTTHDTLRAGDLLGDAELVAHGRDLRTEAGGSTTVLGEVGLQMVIRYVPDQAVQSVSLDPPDPAVDALVGVRASAGFRKALDAAFPGERTLGTLRYQVLDDVPTATLVSGHALSAAGVRVPIPDGQRLQHADLCAGWATGGTIMLELEAGSRTPVVTGPPAPSIVAATDPMSWHEVAPLPPHSTRRWRRIDTWYDTAEIAVDCFFRDSHIDRDGLETVVHEYSVTARIDPTTMRFLSCAASVGALPWLECPAAADSAGRLVGQPLDNLRDFVRESFVGPPTCTHLNDVLRSLQDVPALIHALDAARDPGTETGH